LDGQIGVFYFTSFVIIFFGCVFGDCFFEEEFVTFLDLLLLFFGSEKAIFFVEEGLDYFPVII
jgi:hypothetical protein